MTIELTPEVEEILMAESSATGLSLAEITNRVLAIYTQNQPDLQAARLLGPETLPESSSPSEILRRRMDAGKRMFALREKLADRGVTMPDTPNIRDWIHEGHRF